MRAYVFITIILVIALALRLLYFTGMALGDDVFYITQAMSLSQTGHWPPEPYHWHTRLGVIFPTVLSIKALGAQPLAFVLWPLLASTSGVLVCYLVAEKLAGSQVARLAAIFQAAFPLEVIYSTHLFPDVLVALFSTLGLWCWIRGLRLGEARDFLACGAFFAVGYLCRETIVMEVPIYLTLWILEGCPRHHRMLLTLLMPVLVVSLECGLYAATAGSAFYRWNAVLAQQRNAVNLKLIQESTSGGTFWTDPLLMIVTSHEFGLYHLAALVIAPVALFRWPSARPFAIWLLVGFFWTFYGTTVPTSWVPLQRDPRYAASLTVPSVVLLARGLGRVPVTVRWPIAAVLLGSGIFAAGLDQGQSILAPHRAFVRTTYAQESSLEPFEYVGARWVIGLGHPAVFGCASDQGRGSVVQLLEGLEGTVLYPTERARYFVFSPQRRPELMKKMQKGGWIVVETIPGVVVSSRAIIAQFLKGIPSQQARVERIRHPPGLVVMQNPHFFVPRGTERTTINRGKRHAKVCMDPEKIRSICAAPYLEKCG
jgi:hypothetical protein